MNLTFRPLHPRFVAEVPARLTVGHDVLIGRLRGRGLLAGIGIGGLAQSVERPASPASPRT